MPASEFTATLLRASASGFAGITASRIAERRGGPASLEGGFDAWQAQFKTLVGELAAAADDGGVAAFAAAIEWTRDAFAARGMSTDTLSMGVEELEAVLEESLPASAWESLPPFFAAARTELAREGDAQGQAPPGVGDRIVETYLDKLQAGDGPGAIATVVSAVEAGGLSVADALEQVLTTALREIGHRWHTDVINVAQEHFATQASGRLLERLMFIAPLAPPNGHTVILAMIEGDAHDLGLRIVAGLFELDGWRVICLGANVPTCDLPQAVEDFDASLILLGATLNAQREAVAHAIGTLRAACPDLKVLAGGRAFAGCEDRASEIGADGCVLLPRRAVELGRELVEA